MQVQEEFDLDSPLYDSSAFIPANYNYFNVKLTSEEDQNLPLGLYIIPFQNHDITFTQLLKDLLKKLKLNERFKLSQIQLSLRDGYIVSKHLTAQDLRLKLCRQSASGINLQAKILSETEDEAAIVYYINNESDFNKDRINKWFLLLNNQQPFYISIVKSIDIKQLQKTVVSALNEYYKNSISSEHIRFFKIEKTSQDIVFAWEKVEELVGDQVTMSIRKSEHQIIGVEIVKEGAEWPLSEVSSEEYLIFHINNDNKIKLKFSLIAKYKVGELLQHLKIEHSNSLGIKIVDEIFPPCKLVKEASKYFETGCGKFVKNVECRLVSEKEMFYYSMKRINDPFHIEKKMITQDKEPLYEKCREHAQRRFREFEEAEIKDFSDQKEISPITLYTSSVEIIDPQTNTPNLLYKSLNDHLRTTRFGLSDKFKEEWKYKFSATLIKSLEKIPIYSQPNPQTSKVTVYRGIRGHQLLGQENELYVSKQFMSTSTLKAKAVNFVKYCEIGTFLEIQCTSGRLIKQFSMYEKEQEVLFMPYTYFRIAEKDTSQNVFKMKLVQLEEKEFKCNPATYLLWVDDKLAEGEKVISSLNCPMHTTFLHQLISTSALGTWIEENQCIINNPKIKIVVITNMKRREDEIDVFDAGANTVKLVRQRMNNAEIVFYIGHIQGTKDALTNNGVDPLSVKIFNKRQQLKEFIATTCAPIVEEAEEEVIFQTQSTILKYFDPIQNKAASSKSL